MGILKLFIVLSLIYCCSANVTLDIYFNPQPYYKLPRFWTGSGLAPFAPLPFNRTDVTEQLLSDRMSLNMEYVSALPNYGIQHIRIHWLLSLVKFKGFDARKIPIYNFDDLDSFLDHLINIRLFPVIEFMGDIFPKNDMYDIQYMWKDFVYQLISHYLSRYGQWKLMNFRYELWNEPDLHTYNILNYTLPEYLQYAHGVRSGLEAAGRRMRPVMTIPLRGPAGLFKSIEEHQLCWGLLDYCNANAHFCPIDVITFHRKGNNTSLDILTETIDLLKIFHDKYPNLENMSFANTEADIISGWSKSLKSNADVHYAHALMSIVLQHWNAYVEGSLNGLDSISHDNSFLSYHPFEFEQRTLLARFAMNESHPKSVRFIQKPVYASMGMLSALAKTATKLYYQQNVSYVLSLGEKYAAVLLLSTENTQADEINIELHQKWNHVKNVTFGYLAEFLEQSRTNPYSVWVKYNRPAYPNETVLSGMLHAQGPHVLQSPRKPKKITDIKLKIKFHHPWIVLVRICSYLIPKPGQVKNVRIHRIDKESILIVWNDFEYPNYERCIRTYQIWYAPLMSEASRIEPAKEDPQTSGWYWENLTPNGQLIPFLSYYHHVSPANPSVQGYYKIVPIDIFGRFGQFSKVYKYFD